MDDEGSPGHRIAILPASRLDFADRFQEIPDWVWEPARKGRGKVLFDASVEAKPHEPLRTRTLHDFLERARVSSDQAVYLTQDRGYADAYFAYCKASGERPMPVMVHDYWVGEVIQQHAGDGSKAFEARLKAFRARPDRRERMFLSLNRSLRPAKALFLLRLMHEGLWNHGLISIGGFELQRQQLRLNQAQFLDYLFGDPAFADLNQLLRPMTPRLEAAGRVDFEVPGTARRLGAAMDHPLAEFGRTWFTVVTETEMASRPVRITEKPLKPLMNFHPFIMLGNPGSLGLLREYGFQTFGAVFDEAYDQEPDPRQRFEMVFREVERLCHLDEAELERLGRRVEETVIFNAHHALVDLPKTYRTHLDPELVRRLLAPAADRRDARAAESTQSHVKAPANPSGSRCPMNEISVLGSVLTPEFEGSAGEAESLTNLLRSKGRLHKTDPEAEAEISWVFDSEGGPRGLYLRYASATELPGCRLLVNDTTVVKAAAYESTLGLLDWRYQATAELAPGRNRISLQIHGAPPQIEGLAVGQPPVVSYPSVDEGLRWQKQLRRSDKGKRPLTIRPEQLASLVEFVRRAASDEGEFNQVQRLVEQLVLAIRCDAMDGRARLPWGGPMNGQSYRQLIFHRLMGMGVDAIVETGTHVGASTAFFARRGVPVFSCDLQEIRLAAAIVQLSECRNVTLRLEDSRSFLRGLAADPAFAFSLPLFYLDAHWGDELPLADEVAIVRGRWPNFVIIIDDFQVPGASYTWGDYGEGRDLTLEYLQRSGIELADVAVLFPSAGAEAETGVKRGTLVLTPAALYDEHLASERSLYRVHPSPA